MGSPFDDAALIHNHNAVGVAHRGQPVGNHKGSPAGHQGVHAVLHQLFGPGINGGGGLIQDQGRGIGHRRPGNGQQLPLSLAQVGAVTGEHGIIPVGQAADEAVGVGQLGRSNALLITCLQIAVSDIVHHSAGKQVGILKHNAQGAAKIRLFDLVDIDAVIAYGHQLNLSLDDLDSIITQGKKLGTYMYIYTGGEPLVRKGDIIKLCEMHPDCMFLSFTNGTLIDEAFCQEMLRVKNFVPAISLEGFEAANDSRRGEGVYQKVHAVMALLNSHNLPFGISTCYTSRNVDDVSSERYFDQLIDSGALFAWFFHYMPVGNDAAVELLPSPEQRSKMYHAIRTFRSTKAIFTLDFQNDGEYVGGCIAGGRRYLHINAKGDVEPCVFIHYSNVNIHDVSLLDALKSPLFQAYHRSQPFNNNMLRPCPMLENPEFLPKMVAETGAVNTDYQSPESPEHLCEKTIPYAQRWKPVADALWQESHSQQPS